MNLPKIRIKSPIFVSIFALFLIVAAANIFIYKDNWKKIFSLNINQTATAFNSSTAGNWNIPATWGINGGNIYFQQPIGIAISTTTGKIYVVNSISNSLAIINPDGTGNFYSSSLGLDSPLGISLSTITGNLYVADRHHNEIAVFDLNGNPLFRFGGATLYNGLALSGDQSVTVSDSGNVYISDSDNHRIVITDSLGNYSTSSDYIAFPLGVAIAPDGTFYANDFNAGVATFNPDGSASTTPTMPKVSLGYLSWGLRYHNDKLYVSDVTSPGVSRVVILNLDGTTVTSYNNLDASYLPVGLAYASNFAFDANGDIYIADDFYNRVVILNPDGTASTSINSGTVIPANPVEGVTYPGINDDVTINANITLTQDQQSANKVVLGGGGNLGLAGHILNIPHWWNLVNNGGSLNINGGAINYSASNTDIDTNVTITGGMVTLTQDQNINNLDLVLTGILDLAGHTLNVNGDWTNSGGILITNGGTVNFVSTSTQSISGNNTFENFTKISTASSSLLFDTAGMTTVTGNINLQGSPNNLLSLAVGSSSNSYLLDTLGSSLWGPAGMVVDGQSNIYWVEQGGRVQKYDSNLNNLLTFTGSFCGPRNIAVDEISGYIYVSDSCNIIQVFDSLGNKINEIGTTTPSSVDGQFDSPTGMAFYAGNLYVVDQNNHRIQTLSPSGSFISKFVVPVGTDPGQFSDTLNGMVIDSLGNIYVVDSGNQRVEKFDPSGNYLLQIGLYGSDPGQFYYPAAISIDSSDNLYVADLGKNNVQKFTSSGVFMDAFGSSSNTNNPWGVAVDSANHYLYVANDSNGTIVRFYLPQASNHFNILKTGSGTASFSYLNVSNSNNLSSEKFSCLNGCVDGGGNTNWIFSTPGGHHILPSEIQPANTSLVPVLSSIIISPVNSSITVGSTIQFTSTSLDQYGNIFPLQTYWSSSNKLIGKIDQNGLFTAISSGTAIILNYTGLESASTTIKVASTVQVVLNPSGVGSTTQNYLQTNITELSRIPETFCFTKNLSPGPNYGMDIKRLQIFLNDNGFTVSTLDGGSYNQETWYYGPNTTKALKAFQEKYSGEILKPTNLTVGTGIFGNDTRKKVNDMLGHNCVTTFEYESTSTPIKIATITKEVATSTKIIPEIVLSKPTSTTPVIPQEVKPTPIPQTEPKPTPVKPAQQFDITQIFNKQLVLGIMDIITQSYKDAMLVVQSYITKLKNLVKDSRISITTKVVTTTALVMGAVASISTVAFATPVSFSEIWLIPARIWGLILGALGIRKKQRQWGTVYDSVTKRPLDPVYVSLINTETNKEVSGAITDIDGRYGFLVLPGKYKIVATKTNYIQPSVKMMGKTFDEVYNDLYFGEELLVTEEGQIITKNIPMDSQSFDWNEFAKTKMNVNKFTRQKDITWARISKFVFIIGALISIVAVVVAPEPYNYIIAGFYVLAYILNFIVFKSKKAGTLIEKATKAPLSFAIIKIFREGETEPLTKKIADKFGAYYALVPKGKYYVKIEKKMDDGTYSEIFHSDSMDIVNGVINFDFSL